MQIVSIIAAESDLHFSDSFDQQQVHILLHLHDVGQACIMGGQSSCCLQTLTWQLAQFHRNLNHAGGH